MLSRKIMVMILVVVSAILTEGCISVKAYQKMHLNDKHMALGDKKLKTFEINFQAYREGVAGANGGKVGGGCGCN